MPVAGPCFPVTTRRINLPQSFHQTSYRGVKLGGRLSWLTLHLLGLWCHVFCGYGVLLSCDFT